MLGQVFTFDQLHHQEMLIICFLETEDDGDVGMLERGKRTGLTLQASDTLRVFGKPLGKGFEGDMALQFGVLGFIDDTHASFTELVNDAIVADSLRERGALIRRYSELFGWAHGVQVLRARLENTGRVGILFEDLLNLSAQLGIILASVVKEGLAFRLGKVSNLEEQIFESGRTIMRHEIPPSASCNNRNFNISTSH
jgi:hypothetical protein